MVSKRDSYLAGLDAEKAVGAFLRSEGWTILEHRWTGAGAEVDLIVIKERQLRFVEVKLRSTRDPVGLETVDARKLARIERAATVYLTQFDGFDEACVAVAYVQRGSEAWHIEFFDNPG